MDTISSPPAMWTPTREAVEESAYGAFARFVGLSADYHEMWEWSVADIGRFWGAVADFFDIDFAVAPERVLDGSGVEHARWFPGAALSYPQHVFRNRDPDAVALRFATETTPYASWTWAELQRETSRIARSLRTLGVERGDRVASYLPNIPEAVAAFLATASLGAIWSAAAPEFGVDAVVARFEQIEPKVLLAVDGYVFRGKAVSRDAEGLEIAERIGAHRVRFGHADGSGWDDSIRPSDEQDDTPLECATVPFDHPLWILYSSGTTAAPKAIVHGHGGVLLEHLKQFGLQLGVDNDDVFFWYSTTGWMMWNYLLSSLLVGSSALLYDGDPLGETLWDLAEQAGVTVFGSSAGYYQAAVDAGIDPCRGRDLSRIRMICSTGAPLEPRCYDWVYERFSADVQLCSVSGGTDIVSVLIGAAPTPVYRGELAPASLGTDLRVLSSSGAPVIGEVGEMVIAQPMPSMPLFFWNDPDGSRLHRAYFAQNPGYWTHGDWLEITPRGTGVIAGRSDATINRGGVRFGTSELYNAVLPMPEVRDAVAVHVEAAGTGGRLLLFTALADGVRLDRPLEEKIRARIRSMLSPRHVPDEIVEVPDIPLTSSGKRLEIPIKRILTGAAPDSVLDRASLANPAALQAFIDYATEARRSG